MDRLFLTILNMSLTGAFVIAVLCVVRLPLKKAPKIISYCLWAVAGFRLVFPFSIESVFSLIPFNAQIIPPDIATQTIPRIDSGIPFVNNTVSSVLPAAAPAASVNPLQIWTATGARIWLVGVAVMLIYGVVSFVILRRQMNEAANVEANIYEAENIKSPFVLGVFKPRVYLPIGLTAQEKSYIILHEQTHIRRHDHIVKFAAYFVLCLHWFNPLAWAAFLLMGVDMEMSCDERVLKEMGGETKKDYSMSLLSLATERRIIGGSPLAFGEGGVKERIKNVLNFRKQSRVIIIAAVMLAAVLSLGFAVNRASDETDIDIPGITATETIDDAQAEALVFGYSWYDGKDGIVADAIAPWQGEYADENTLVIDGEMGQNFIALSAENPMTADYFIYLPDGTVYDDGTRAWHDSLSPRLYWTNDKAGIGVIAPFEPGEYIYAVTIRWKEHNIEATYGFKLVLTGKHNAYDEALRIVWEQRSEARSVSFKEVQLLPASEYAGYCYIFEVELPDNTEQVAVSKERGIFFTYENDTWWAFTGAAEWSGATQNMTLDDVRALAQKIGTDLTMGDLRDFIGTDVGHGLYVMLYEIVDSDYVLLVGSVNMTDVSYAYLLPHAGAEMEEAIDIRYYDVDRYLANGTRIPVRPLPQSNGATQQEDIYALIQRVENSLSIIMSSPQTSSNPQDYINEHLEEYENLAAKYSDGVLDYLLSEFEAGNSDGLRGHIMMRICKDILGPSNNVSDESLSPQKWYSQLSIISETWLPEL